MQHMEEYMYMSFNSTATGLDGLAAVYAVSKALQRIDPRLMEHGERVAFIACELCDEGMLPIDSDFLFLLSMFHDIGAYKTDEIDRMVEFETGNVRNHAVYGYLFLKYMSPLSDFADAILYHHTPWAEIETSRCTHKEYAGLIHLADRIDIAFLNRKDNKIFKMLTENYSDIFRQEYVDLAIRCFEKRNIFARLSDGSYKNDIAARLHRLYIPTELTLKYLKMLACSIDFRSEYTVTHTVNTVSIAINIARHFGIDEEQLSKIYLGALLHDVGKIAIPIEILEHPGHLDPAQTVVMRTHIVETEHIIKGIISDEIVLIAARHHEKLDGSGYPNSLTGESLDFSQRIVAVADIVSALVSRRSYKEPFPKEKTIEILQKMRGKQLDADICDYVCSQYDFIERDTDNSRNAIIAKYQAMLKEYESIKKLGASAQ